MAGLVPLQDRKSLQHSRTFDGFLHPVQERKREKKNKSIMLCKRRKTLLKKAHDLYRDCDADVFLVIRNKRNNQLWQYSNGFRPPSSQELVRKSLVDH